MAAAVSTRAGKQALIGEVRVKFDKSTSAVFVDYKGMTVESATKLRASFRKAGVEYKVVKNTLVRHALKDTEYLDVWKSLPAPAFAEMMTDNLDEMIEQSEHQPLALWTRLVARMPVMSPSSALPTGASMEMVPPLSSTSFG